MGFKELDIDISYETSGARDGLLEKFYIPLLQNSTKYYRIAGFFSSSSLIVASRGIEGLVKNGGKMYLLISPELSADDYETIKAHGSISEDSRIFSELNFDKMPHENIQALAWLLDNNRLEIKIVISKISSNSLFHQKVGIAFDAENNIIAFSGSVNETASAWLHNIEEFKVFKSWIDGQLEYVQNDLAKFISYWKDDRKDIAEVYDVPKAIKDKIIEQKPRDIWDLNIMRKYKSEERITQNRLSLFGHQMDAVSMWIANEKKLLMEMATGTGKTRTAIGCMIEQFKEKENICVIVATPQITLSQQWENDLVELGIELDKSIVVPGKYTSRAWKTELELLLLDLNEKKINRAIVFTTHDTASSDAFISIIEKNKFNTKYLYVADEVHAVGSAYHQRALIDCYDYRIGLSATPERMFDDIGTSLIRDYFGNRSFEFTIADALATINPVTGKPFLNQFFYHPIFVELTDEEFRLYNQVTQQIVILRSQEDYDPDDLQMLYERRAKISKNAENKYQALRGLLDQLNPIKIVDTLLFVSDQQIEMAFEILTEKNIKRAKITEAESANKIVNSDGETERQELIHQFKDRRLQVLVGMKCLDEGIDIKNARVAILMSNSTNPREYVQRVGRVIRQADGKSESEIYDFIVVPPSNTNSNGILEKEGRRANQIAVNAVNYLDVIRMFRERGLDLNAN